MVVYGNIFSYALEIILSELENKILIDINYKILYGPARSEFSSCPVIVGRKSVVTSLSSVLHTTVIVAIVCISGYRYSVLEVPPPYL